MLHSLVKRIKTLDDIINNLNDPKAIILAYENIEFFEQPGLPRKQNKDYRIRLSQEMLTLVDELVTEYEKT